MKHIKKLFRASQHSRSFAAIVCGIFLVGFLAGVTSPFTTSRAIAAGPPSNPGGAGSAESQQAGLLGSINTVEQAKTLFSIHKTFDVSWHKDGFQPRSNASSFDKYKGNPYLEWSDEGGKARTSIGGVPTRFVLTAVQVRSGDSGVMGADGNHNGLLWIFKNEYNPNLAVVRWPRSGTGPVAAEAFDRFVYATGGCGSYAEAKGFIAGNKGKNDALGTIGTQFQGEPDMSFRPDPNLPTEDGPDVKKLTEQYKLESCKVDDGFFAQAINKALGLVKEIISSLFNWVKNALLGVINLGTLSSNGGLVAAWKTLRDFVNLLFVLVLIAIAFSNILRIDTEKYGVRALLPRLVFAVIAVNYSFFLVQIMVNIAYIVSQPFLSAAMNSLAHPPADGSLIDPAAGIGQFFITLLLVLAILIGFVVLFFFFIVRILVIWLLAALSPFVFLFMVLPITRSLAGMWWKNAVKWIFMAPISFIILFIAAEMLSQSKPHEDINGPDFLLKIAFFAGAAFAAVMIPLKLGGEVMGRAAAVGRGGGKGVGTFGLGAALGAAGGSKNPLKFGRQGGAYLEQRKANQEQEAKLGAITAHSKLAGVRGIGGILTGGSRGTAAAQGAAAESKYGKDIESLGADAGTLQAMAANDTKHINNPELRDLAEKPAARRAAGRILAQKGLLSNANARRPEMFQAGVHEALRPYQPVIGNMDRNGEWHDEQMGAVASQAESSGADATKQVHWSSVLDSLEKGSADEQRVARHYVANLSNDAIEQNFERGNRNYISSDYERKSLQDTLVTAGKPYLGRKVGPERPDKDRNEPPSPPPALPPETPGSSTGNSTVRFNRPS